MLWLKWELKTDTAPQAPCCPSPLNAPDSKGYYSENCVTQWFPGPNFWVFSCSINACPLSPPGISFWAGPITPIHEVFRKHVALVIPMATVGHPHPQPGCPVVSGPSPPSPLLWQLQTIPGKGKKRQPWNWWPSTSPRWPKRSWSHIETDPVHISHINALHKRLFLLSCQQVPHITRENKGWTKAVFWWQVFTQLKLLFLNGNASNSPPAPLKCLSNLILIIAMTV